MTDISEIVGGSAWGAGTVAGGDGSRQPSIKELQVALIQRQQFGNMIKAYARGKQALTEEEASKL